MSVPTLGTISVDSDLRVQVPVDDMSGNPIVQVDYAVAETEPATGSKLWKLAGRLEATGSVKTPAMLPSTRVWIRASGRVQLGPWYIPTSVFTEPEYIEVDDGPRFAAVSVRLDSSRRPVVEWDAGPLMAGVQIEWSIYERGGAVPDSFVNVAHIDAADSAYQISESIGAAETVAILVTAYSGWDSDHETVDGDAGQEALFVESPGAPDVERHAFTHEVGGSDELDLGSLVITSPDGTRFRLTVDNSGSLGTEEITESSSSS